MLEAAAEQAGVNLSDFVRSKTIEAAEMEFLERRLVTVSAQNWGKIEAWVDASPRDIPASTIFGAPTRGVDACVTTVMLAA